MNIFDLLQFRGEFVARWKCVDLFGNSPDRRGKPARLSAHLSRPGAGVERFYGLEIGGPGAARRQGIGFHLLRRGGGGREGDLPLAALEIAETRHRRYPVVRVSRESRRIHPRGIGGASPGVSNRRPGSDLELSHHHP